MRRFLHRNRWATALVVVFFVFATSGLAVTRMTCLIGGHSELSLGLAEECCPESEHADGPTVKATCCDLATVLNEREEYLPHANTVFIVDGLLLENALVSIAPPAPVRLTTWLQSRPPPLAGCDRLVEFGVQRV